LRVEDVQMLACEIEKLRFEANTAAQNGDYARVLDILEAFAESDLTDSDKRLMELARLRLRSA